MIKKPIEVSGDVFWFVVGDERDVHEANGVLLRRYATISKNTSSSIHDRGKIL
jgi:hypothetical protein